MGKDLVIAADFGTSAVKVGVGGADGLIIARSVQSYPLALAPGGRAEQSPEDWWQALCRGVADLATQVPDLRNRVGALSVCAQLCGLVCVDRAGTPLRPAMLWLDTRAAELTRELVGGVPSVFGYGALKLWRWVRLANGAPARSGTDAVSKMLWVMREEPQVAAATHLFLDVKDWIIHRASGTFCTTADSANLTWLMDTRPGRESWSPALAQLAGVALERLPPIVEGSAVVGSLTPSAAKEIGLGADVMVLGGAGDIAAAAVGSGATADGEMHICAATGGWVSGFFPQRVLSARHAYATICSPLSHRPLLIAAQETAGAALAWAAQATGADMATAYDGLGPMRADDPFLLPWHAGERTPVDDDRLRGVLHGLTLAHDGAAIRRAALEGVVLNLHWAWQSLAATPGLRHDGPVPLVGGGADLPAFTRLMAAALNRPVEVQAPRDAGVRGALYIAAPVMGWATDVWAAAAAARATTHPQRTDPDPQDVALMAERAARLDRLRPALIRSFSGRGMT